MNTLISCDKGRSNSSESTIEGNCFWHEIFWLHNRISLFIDSLLFNSEAHYFYRTKKINTGGEKRAAPSTRHAARLATSFDPVIWSAKFAVSRCLSRCLAFADGSEACEAISRSFFSPFAQAELLWDVNSIDISFSEGSSSVLDSSSASRPQMKFSLLVSLIKLASKFRN